MSTTFSPVTAAELAEMEFPPLAPEPETVPTWEELVALDPRLVGVQRLAIERRSAVTSGSVHAWGDIKRVMMRLVGWAAEVYELRTSTAYNVAYDHLLRCWEGADTHAHSKRSTTGGR